MQPEKTNYVAFVKLGGKTNFHVKIVIKCVLRTPKEAKLTELEAYKCERILLFKVGYFRILRSASVKR